MAIEEISGNHLRFASINRPIVAFYSSTLTVSGGRGRKITD